MFKPGWDKISFLCQSMFWEDYFARNSRMRRINYFNQCQMVWYHSYTSINPTKKIWGRRKVGSPNPPIPTNPAIIGLRLTKAVLIVLEIWDLIYKLNSTQHEKIWEIRIRGLKFQSSKPIFVTGILFLWQDISSCKRLIERNFFAAHVFKVTFKNLLHSLTSHTQRFVYLGQF